MSEIVALGRGEEDVFLGKMSSRKFHELGGEFPVEKLLIFFPSVFVVPVS